MSEQTPECVEVAKPQPRENIETRRSTHASVPISLKVLLRNVREETEKSAIDAALDRTCWNRTTAARLLQISYRAPLYRLKQHQMMPPSC